MNKVSKKPRKKHVLNPELVRKRELIGQEILKLYHEGIDLQEIGKRVSRSYAYVIFILRKHKSELSIYPFHSYKVGKRNEKIANDYLAGLTIKEIALKYEMENFHVTRILKTFGIYKKPLKKKDEITKNQLKKIRNVQIEEDYIKGMEIAALSNKYSLHPEHIKNLLRAKHVQFRRKSHEQLLPNLYGEDKDKRDLKVIEEYKKGPRVVDIAIKFSLKRVTVYKILWKYGIKPSLNPIKRPRIKTDRKYYAV